MHKIRPQIPVLQTIGFVCLGLGAMLFLVTQITHSRVLERRRATYRVIAVFENVGQLQSGAPVSIAGVDIGLVQSIDVVAGRLQAVVTMDLDKEIDRIPIDSDASINTQGVLGRQFIRIQSGRSSHYLRDGDRLSSTHPAISIETMMNRIFQRRDL